MNSFSGDQTILLVEDDPGLASLVTGLIEGIGCTVRHATSGGAVLMMLADAKPTLVVLDCSLPDMTATELLDRIRERGLDLPPFIVATGAGDEHVAVDLMRRGAANYLIKNREFLGILSDTIRRALRDIEMTQRLTVAERKLRLAARALEGAAEAVMITDMAHRVVDVNPAFERLTGRTASEMIGLTLAALLPGYADDAEVNDGIIAGLETDGRWQGEVSLRRASGEVFTAWFNISRIENVNGDGPNYVALFSDISSVKSMAEHLDYLAHHDPLTGLPNRLLFNARLRHSIDRAARGRQSLGLLFLDLDHFKEVNDRLGHAAGDDLLRTLAARMGTLLREEDTLARLGGDEFVLLVEEAESAEDLQRVIRQVLDLFPHPVATPQGTVNITASIGGALYPRDATCCDDLLACADEAMYAAKQAGRNTFVLFGDQSAPEPAAARLSRS